MGVIMTAEPLNLELTPTDSYGVPKMPKAINARLLRRLGACAAQVDAFVGRYGESDAPLTVKEAIAVAGVFDFDWLAGRLLEAPAWEAYEAATAPTREAYEAADALAREAHEAATALAWEAYEATTAPEWEAYEAAKAPAREAHEAAKALAFAVAYLAA